MQVDLTEGILNARIYSFLYNPSWHDESILMLLYLIIYRKKNLDLQPDISKIFNNLSNMHVELSFNNSL